MTHEVERYEDLMYHGCESHWHCIYCDNFWPFHCYPKGDLEKMECPARVTGKETPKYATKQISKKAKKKKNVYIVSWYDYGEPPVVTAFDNQKAAEKYRDYESCQDHEKVCLDECPVYSTFTEYDQ